MFIQDKLDEVQECTLGINALKFFNLEIETLKSLIHPYVPLAYQWDQCPW